MFADLCLASEPFYITPEYKDCLKTLDYPGSGNRRAAIEKSHKSTLGWLDTDPAISGWFKSKTHFVWVLGKAGSGKSTLSKHTLGCLNKSTQHLTKKPGEATSVFSSATEAAI